MEVKILHLLEGAKQAKGITVIIDVFRAFTVETYLSKNGAAKIIPVGDMQFAFDYKKDHPDAILCGERGGKIIDGFDYGNSPSQVEHVDFTGKTVIHTTSAGTQGIANATGADEIIAGNLVAAKAIARYIRAKNPEHVSLVCMGLAGGRQTDEDELCGSRSGTATTDPDSVAMHPKDDVRHTGPCLPMYNLQLMTQSQFILWAGLYGNPSDTSVFPGFLDSIPENFIPDMMACDAGYGTYVNVTLAERKEIKSFFKYNKYDKESAPRFKADPYSVEYMPELEDGSLKCPGGTLKKEYEVEEEQHGITVTTVYYRTDECAKCPLREECHKKDLKDFREAKRKKEWAAKKQEVKERLDSKLGQTLLSNRSRDVEPTFAHTKWAGSYRRCRHFGAKKCNMDLLIRAIAHNLKKYSVYITELIKIAKKRAEKGSGKGCTPVFSVQIRA